MALPLLYIRHLVCSKGIRVVREQLGELGELGLRDAAATIDWLKLRECLEAEGFELLDQLSPPPRLVAQIKEIIIHLLAPAPTALRSGHFSWQPSERLQRRSAYLSDVFSATEGLSLEQYVSRQRMEAARCLLRDGTLPVGRVARELGYSNLGHLSRQFQRATGTSPTEYRCQCRQILVHDMEKWMLPARGEMNPGQYPAV